MHLEDPEKNVFKVPYFLKDRIISNDMCKIVVLLLHYDPEHRYESLAAVKDDLLKLRKSIFETPLLLRQVLKHPILPSESIDLTKLQYVDFRPQKNPNPPYEIINKFSLKYLAKFINEHDIDKICLHGGELPIREIK
jgi:hypothetical protein